MKRICPLCFKNFARTDYFNKHVKDKICQKKINRTCEVCGKTFSRTIDYKNHVENKTCLKDIYSQCSACGVISKGNELHICQYIFQCERCKVYFYNEECINRHLCGQEEYLLSRGRCIHGFDINTCLRCTPDLLPIGKMIKFNKCIVCHKHVPFYRCYFNRGDGQMVNVVCLNAARILSNLNCCRNPFGN
jgi:hypothetical protein